MTNWMMIGSGTDKKDILINLDAVAKIVGSHGGSIAVHFIGGDIINVHGDAGRIWELMKQATLGNAPPVKV